MILINKQIKPGKYYIITIVSYIHDGILIVYTVCIAFIIIFALISIVTPLQYNRIPAAKELPDRVLLIKKY